MKTIRLLTEEERNTLANGLHVAVERYKANISRLRTARCPNCLDVPGKNGLGRVCAKCGGTAEVLDTAEVSIRLADQFARQCKESTALAELIENAKDIHIEKGEKMALTA